MHTPPADPAPKRRNLRHTISSIRYSLDGFFAAFKHEPSFREDLYFVGFLIPFALLLRVNAVNTAIMIASLFLIIIAELLNSAIEWTIDYISTEKHPMAKRAKDMASAAVFVSYVNCIAVWGIIISAKWSRLW